ncbi:hypothetical protein BC832DRAFT_401224 [Gaertneriomyces semiglobifer]|nr:hypothetical protein BC832DRAFT_401224 [Gaertneriomyces semiglobifer]
MSDQLEFVWKANFPKPGKRGYTTLYAQLPQLAANRRLLFRGITSGRQAVTMFRDALYASASRENEFGPGLYMTDSVEAALEYAGLRGAVLIFDYTSVPEKVVEVHPTGEDWTRTVRGYILDDKPGVEEPPTNSN